MRQIIVLEVTQANPGQKLVKVAFWFPIAQAKAYPKPTFQSGIDPTLAGANAPTNAEIADLRAGVVLEEVANYPFASSFTNAEIKAELQRLYTDRAVAIAALPNPIAFYGVSYDPATGGTGWSA